LGELEKPLVNNNTRDTKKCTRKKKTGNRLQRSHPGGKVGQKGRKSATSEKGTVGEVHERLVKTGRGG